MLNLTQNFRLIDRLLFWRKSADEIQNSESRLNRQIAKEANMIERVFTGLEIGATVAHISISDHGNFILYHVVADSEKSRKAVIAIDANRWTGLFTAARGGDWVNGRLCPITLTIEAPFYGRVKPLLWSDANTSKLRFGKAIVGRQFTRNGCADLYIDLTDSRSPHVLVAAMSGGGKTVAIVNMLVSLCLSASPERLVVYAIDTKGAIGESKDFDGMDSLPHMHRVQDPQVGVELLASIVAEMDARSKTGASSPLVIVAIDEMSDLIRVSSDAKNHITRIAQIGRQRGIHLIAGTQNPSRETLGGDMVSNFPCRLVGRVVDKTAGNLATGMTDVGAERLPGNGSFYFILAGDPIRFQSFYLQADDTRAIAEAITGRYGTDKIDVIDLTQDDALSPAQQDAQRIFDAFENILNDDGKLSVSKANIIRFLTGDDNANTGGANKRRADAAIAVLTATTNENDGSSGSSDGVNDED